MSSDAITDALFEIVHATDLHDGIAITERRHLTEWGASGSEWQYLVEVASMLDEVAIAIAIEKAFEKIAAILGSRGEPVLDRDQALSFAKTSILIQNPSLQYHQLVLVSEENDHDANRWSFGFRPGDGWEYVAEVGWQRRLPSLTRVRRQRIEKSE